MGNIEGYIYDPDPKHGGVKAIIAVNCWLVAIEIDYLVLVSNSVGQGTPQGTISLDVSVSERKNNE